MDKKELWKLLCEREKQVEAARIKRTIKTILAFSVANFLLFYFNDRQKELLDIAGDILASIFLAGFYFWIGSIIFSALCKKRDAENEMLDQLKKQLSEAETNEQNVEQMF